MNTYKTFDIIVVPFPFTTDTRAKLRPAIVMSSDEYFNNHIEHSVCAMITSAQHNPWPLDVDITELTSCGLKKASKIRLKLFTIDNRLIRAKIGYLSEVDRTKLCKHIALGFNQLVAK